MKTVHEIAQAIADQLDGECKPYLGEEKYASVSGFIKGEYLHLTLKYSICEIEHTSNCGIRKAKSIMKKAGYKGEVRYTKTVTTEIK